MKIDFNRNYRTIALYAMVVILCGILFPVSSLSYKSRLLVKIKLFILSPYKKTRPITGREHFVIPPIFTNIKCLSHYIFTVLSGDS